MKTRMNHSSNFIPEFKSISPCDLTAESIFYETRVSAVDYDNANFSNLNTIVTNETQNITY